MNALARPSYEHSVPAGALDDVAPDDGTYPNQLPAFGSIGDDPASHGQAIAYLQRIGQESAGDNRAVLDQADQNASYYRWGQSCEPDPERVIANDIQSAVLAITDIQTRDAYSVFIRPVQTRDVPQVFWLGPPVDAVLAGLVPGLPLGLGMEPVLDPVTGQPMMEAVPVADPVTGQPIGQTAQPMMQPAHRRDTPLDQVTAWQVRKILATGAFPSEWLFVLDDRAVADVYQTAHDVYWKQDKLDDFVWEHQLKANVYGYQTASYGWDAQRKRHVVRDVSIKQARLDPNADGSSMELQNCPGYEMVYDRDEAKALWPQLADLIEQYAREGSPQRNDSYSDFGAAANRDFKRRTVTFLVHWFRNQSMPMTPEEATTAGHVEYDEAEGVYRSTQVMETQDAGLEEEVAAQGSLQTAEGASQALGPAGVDGSSELDLPAVPAPRGGEGKGDQRRLPQRGVLSAGGGDAEDRADGGAGLEADIANVFGAGPVDSQGSTGSLSTPPGPEWPLTTGIRQIATIAATQRVVQDIRCEHWDIPLLLTVCIPLPSRPYGQGLPEKLRGLQQADIRLLNACVKYAEIFANPGCIIPTSVANALPRMNRLHVDPTETMVSPDHLIERFGEKMINWFVPPPMPPAVAQVMQMIDQRTKETSGHPEVMQGVAPSPTSSGKMIEALQSGAAGQFGFQAKSTLRTVERLANLMHYTHLWRLSLEDMVELYGRLPPEIMALVIDRARKGRWDNTVDANGAAGGQRNKKLQEALTMFQTVSASTGEPVMPLRMVREAAGIDSEEASLAFRAELATAMPAAGPGQQPGQPGQPGQEQQGQQGPPGGGEGEADRPV